MTETKQRHTAPVKSTKGRYTRGTRVLANVQYQASLRERKRLRKKRAAIHAALTTAAFMAKSRKKGTSKDVGKNMETLGYARIDAGPDVLQKWREASA